MVLLFYSNTTFLYQQNNNFLCVFCLYINGIMCGFECCCCCCWCCRRCCWKLLLFSLLLFFIAHCVFERCVVIISNVPRLIHVALGILLCVCVCVDHEIGGRQNHSMARDRGDGTSFWEQFERRFSKHFRETPRFASDLRQNWHAEWAIGLCAVHAWHRNQWWDFCHWIVLPHTTTNHYTFTILPKWI